MSHRARLDARGHVSGTAWIVLWTKNIGSPVPNFRQASANATGMACASIRPDAAALVVMVFYRGLHATV
jgi:hypothetical protein